MIEHLTERGWSRQQAYIICSVAVDLKISALVDVFQGTVSGRGRIATITGEPGIGKTSLVEEVLAEIAIGPHRPVIVRGRCSAKLRYALRM